MPRSFSHRSAFARTASPRRIVTRPNGPVCAATHETRVRDRPTNPLGGDSCPAMTGGYLFWLALAAGLTAVVWVVSVLDRLMVVIEHS